MSTDWPVNQRVFQLGFPPAGGLFLLPLGKVARSWPISTTAALRGVLSACTGAGWRAEAEADRKTEKVRRIGRCTIRNGVDTLTLPWTCARVSDEADEFRGRLRRPACFYSNRRPE
jgi:hypothetical protein